MRLLFERMRRDEHRYCDINVLHLMVNCASYLRKAFLARFTGMDSTLVWISVLNPIFVKLNHLSDTEKEMVRSKVIQLMVDQSGACSKQPVPEDDTTPRRHRVSTGSSTMMTLLGEEGEGQ